MRPDGHRRPARRGRAARPGPVPPGPAAPARPGGTPADRPAAAARAHAGMRLGDARQECRAWPAPRCGSTPSPSTNC
ncbi:hypothetical protein ACFQ60_45120 [Streptomyces zhihengii]